MNVHDGDDEDDVDEQHQNQKVKWRRWKKDELDAASALEWVRVPIADHLPTRDKSQFHKVPRWGRLRCHRF